jgi:HEAT repeat protein
MVKCSLAAIIDRIDLVGHAVAAVMLAYAVCVSVGCCSKEGVPDAIKKLYSAQAKERNAAALALAKCGTLAEPAVPRLAAMLYDPNPGVQSSSAYALREIGSPPAVAAIERAEAARAAKRARK